MASLVVMPDLITFMDQLSVEGENTTNLEEVEIEDFTDQIAREYMNRLMTARDIGGLLAERDANQFVRPFVQK